MGAGASANKETAVGAKADEWKDFLEKATKAQLDEWKTALGPGSFCDKGMRPIVTDPDFDASLSDKVTEEEAKKVLQDGHTSSLLHGWHGQVRLPH